jgi:hypothetical protein
VFVSTHSSVVCEYFRIPYRVEAGSSSCGSRCAELRGGPGSLVWPISVLALDDAFAPYGPYRLDSIPIFCRVIPDPTARVRFGVGGSGWSAVLPVRDPDDRAIASVWQHTDGRIFLPFDPDEAIASMWTERYETAGRSRPRARAQRLALRTYYRLRPLVPRAAQIAFRRRLARLQARRTFPRWPIEPALHDLYDLLLSLLAKAAGEPVPWIASWPHGFAWALVLTHDVETEAGYLNVPTVRDLEARLGYRSAWNFVPLRDYRVDDDFVHQLEAAAFEVGVHGLHHDGRDLESRETLEARLPAIREWAQRWNAVGFRAPATLRRWEWMPLLGFDYDSSTPDTDPFEPQAGGCCSWLPFFNDGLVELPITLPHDHTLFTILRRRDESIWLEKTATLRERGGMALLVTHPDYLSGPELLSVYERFLETHTDDHTVWRALPRDVSAWWRRRSETTIEWDGAAWTLVGPASEEARLAFAADQAV